MNNDIAIVFCGEAGQGIDTATEITVQCLKDCEINMFSIKEYMSRIRGGANSSQIRISQSTVHCPTSRIDILIALSQSAISHLAEQITPETLVLFEPQSIDFDADCQKIEIPINEIIKTLGSKIYANSIYSGVIAGLLNLDIATCENTISKTFSKYGDEITAKNIKAFELGYKHGLNLSDKTDSKNKIKNDSSTKDKILITGNDAVSIGAIAGGCDFISSYPMSPATGVLTYLSQKAEMFNIIEEQTEDEIAAANMAIGAWYAGARAIVSTSGGGYSLMCEALSLAGMIESPLVIHLAQRPGPATGLPTRTEQGDLALALYSGHGEFPRIILTPGNPKDAFELVQNAFNLADKYQVPVFILTDQYLLDSINICKPFETDNIEIQEHITKSEANYKRYQLNENGISPRSIPAFGDGLVNVDSDEHDEDGHITEDLKLRVEMVQKRLKKIDSIKQESYPAELIGDPQSKTLIIGWGSTYGVLKELVKRKDNLSFLYLKQVYPLPNNLVEHLQKAHRVICVENNATSQLAKLIRQEASFEIKEKILKYNGLPFYIDELMEKIQ